MLQIALVHHISKTAQKLIVEQLQKFKVESLIERTINKKESSNPKPICVYQILDQPGL